jgi:hypothetical protein
MRREDKTTKWAEWERQDSQQQQMCWWDTNFALKSKQQNSKTHYYINGNRLWEWTGHSKRFRPNYVNGIGKFVSVAFHFRIYARAAH